MRIITLAVLLILVICSCSKEEKPFDPNEILYGEWEYQYYFESIWKDELDTNYTVVDTQVATFLPNGKLQSFRTLSIAPFNIDSFFYKINESRDTLFKDVFFQSGSYGFENVSWRKQKIDTFSNDYFRISERTESYDPDSEKTSLNYTVEEYFRQ